MRDDLRRIRTDTVDLCLRDTGSGPPTVVLLHGTTANLGVWDRVVSLLGTRIRAVAVDQRGHGRSGRPGSGYGATEYCHDVVALVAELACAPVVVVGHSLGARNAVVLGATRPDVVAGVVALDYAPYVEPDVLDDLEVRVRAGDRRFGSEDEIGQYLRARYPLMPADAVQRRISYGYTRDGHGWRPLADPTAMALTVDGLRDDFVDAMRRIEVPVTLVRGEHSKILSREAFAATQQLRPDVRAIELLGTDHYVPEERPDAVAEEIMAMIAMTA